MESLQQLRSLLDQLPPRLRELPDSKQSRRPNPEGWSPKEELGHLLDSAVCNHQRIVHGQLSDGQVFPRYEQRQWVEIHRYQERDWDELIELWTMLNRHLLVAAEAVPRQAWAHTCSVGPSEPMTLQFVFEDYLRHMLHHLAHIGIKVDDLEACSATS